MFHKKSRNGFERNMKRTAHLHEHNKNAVAEEHMVSEANKQWAAMRGCPFCRARSERVR